jgi:rhodanese-related sulfurtransferase
METTILERPTELRAVDPAKARRFFEDKITFTTGPVELDRMIRNGEKMTVVDVRAAEDYRAGHIPCAINLPKENWHTLEGLTKDQVNVIYCYSHVCHLAAFAAAKFASRGFPVMEMDGGFKSWQELELEVES